MDGGKAEVFILCAREGDEVLLEARQRRVSERLEERRGHGVARASTSKRFEQVFFCKRIEVR